MQGVSLLPTKGHLVETMEALLVALVILPGLALVIRFAFLPNGIGFEDLLRRTDLDWPHGVQEEEAAPWHIDRLNQGSRS
jgi:hypothetical protein